MEKVQQLSVLAMLGGYSLSDIKNRNLHTFWMKIFFIEGFLMQIFTWGGNFRNLILPLLPGIGLFFLSKLTKGSIGEGDGILVFISGLFLDVQEIWQVICAAVFTSAIFAMFLFFIAKKQIQYEMPFVPFLLVGYVLLLY